MGVEPSKDGVVLPHGGLWALSNVHFPDLQWASAKMGLKESILDHSGKFALKGNKLGHFCRKSLVIPLLLINETRGNRWLLALDGVRPVGCPEYFMTKETAMVLSTGYSHGDGTIEFEGKRYRLFAAFFEVAHVALLMRAKW